MSKVALITGITGQDGSYLAEFLLEKGYEVHGIVRRASISNTARINHLIEKNVIKLHDGDLSDSSGLIRLVGEIRPDEIYNLAAQSHVQVSFDAPEYSGGVDALGVLRVLEAVRVCGLTKTCKVYQASTSELYGKVEEVPQKETTPFHPYSPYAVAKQYGFWMVKEYRDAYGMFAVNGILFNHESERRGENFVTRKITLAAGRIAEGLQDHLELGNMDSLRDWGHAKDYIKMQWMMLQQEQPEDFVIATGVQYFRTSVRGNGGRHSWASNCALRHGCEEKGIVVSVTGHDAPGVKPGDVIIAVDRVTSVRQKLKRCSATRPKRTKNWAGNRKSPSERWCLKWWLMTSKRRKTLSAEISRLRRGDRAGVISMSKQRILSLAIAGWSVLPSSGSSNSAVMWSWYYVPAMN